MAGDENSIFSGGIALLFFAQLLSTSSRERSQKLSTSRHDLFGSSEEWRGAIISQWCNFSTQSLSHAFLVDQFNL